MKSIIIDLDQTICFAHGGDIGQSLEPSARYAAARPDDDVITKIRSYRDRGFRIVIHTSRNMRTYNGDVAAIRRHSLPIILDWLARHDVPYDDIVIGKPWCGYEGFYVDDRAIRPSEFRNLTFDQISDMLAREQSL